MRGYSATLAAAALLALLAQPPLAASIALLLAGSNTAFAQSAPPSPVSQEVSTRRFLRIPIGTVVQVEIVERLTSETNHRNDAVTLRLAEPITSHGVVLVPAGAEGGGEILDSANVDDTRPGKLVVAGRFLNIGGRRVGLRMQIMAAGEIRRDTIWGWSGYGVTSSIAMDGEAITIPAGTRAQARLTEDVEVELVSTTALPAGADFQVQPEEITASSAVGQPPAGYGRVVFFRVRTIQAAMHTFSVRDDDTDIGRLASGSRFIYDAAPGIHEFNVGSLRDTLRFEIEPGATYYVMGTMTIATIMGRAVLTPSDQATFEDALPRLRVSEPRN